MVSPSNLGGVPVLSLPIFIWYFANCSLNPVDGFSSKRPAGIWFSPICISPFKKVPVVKINSLHLISVPFWDKKPTTLFSLSSNINFTTGSAITVKFL